jgi:hypothetical protein
VDASLSAVAKIESAILVIITIGGRITTGAVHTGLTAGTRIIVRAGAGIGGVLTSRTLVAHIVSANILIVTHHRCSKALPPLAQIVDRAGVVISAKRGDGFVHALPGIAGINGAYALVVALQGRRHTLAAHTGIADGARLAVIAGLGVVHKLASQALVTARIHAGVTVIAFQRLAYALGVAALVIFGAGVLVVAIRDAR